MRRRETERACLLILNGEIPELGPVKALAAKARGVLCADGGARHAIRLKIEPDFVVGDMDSLPHPLPPWRRTVYWCDFNENLSDFEKALNFARELGCRRVYVAGALGGRTDQTLVNLALIERFSAKLEIILIDRGTARLLGPGRHVLDLRRGAIFSLLACPRAVVSLSGARYPLRETALQAGSRGLSNVATGPVRLDIRRGRLWLMAA